MVLVHRMKHDRPMQDMLGNLTTLFWNLLGLGHWVFTSELVGICYM